MITACWRLALLSLPLLLAACGGGTIGGTVSGLPDGDSVTLQNNGGDDELTVTKNGAFEFDEMILEERAYSVTVSKQPAAANCVVTSGSGTVAVDQVEVADVVVTCARNATLIGTVTGLAQGGALTLLNTRSGTTETLNVSTNGAFAFPGIRSGGENYSVTVSVQPSLQTCTVTNGSGTVVAGKQTEIGVACN
jgi:uncharacterized protein (UPF0179 family)